MNYKIIQDTREKAGWAFSKNDYWSGMEVSKLDTGDYAIKGHEKAVCIERKMSVSEIAGNLIRNFPTFQRELVRMQEYDQRYIICEFSLSELLEYPKGTHANKGGRRTTNGPFILKKLLRVQIDYDVKVMFCDNPGNAYKAACQIFKEVITKL